VCKTAARSGFHAARLSSADVGSVCGRNRELIERGTTLPRSPPAVESGRIKNTGVTTTPRTRVICRNHVCYRDGISINQCRPGS